jgi:hypothetical protein
VNLIALSGVYPNQPQSHTGWKLELRRGGVWEEHARGVGGWYDRGRYVWGGSGTVPVRFEALRISVFSPDADTSLRSVHFRGEPGLSWIVARVPRVDVEISHSPDLVRPEVEVTFRALPKAGDPDRWRWSFGDGFRAVGEVVTHTYTEPGRHRVRLTVADDDERAVRELDIDVESPVRVRMRPLESAVSVGEPVTFAADPVRGAPDLLFWDLGAGGSGTGPRVTTRFPTPGIQRVRVTGARGPYAHSQEMLVRVESRQAAAPAPSVVLDTDQKNEQDDQYYLGYALFSELDILAVNTVHHGGGQEALNYAEVLHVLDLARKSGFADEHLPPVFRGADRRLTVPASGRWMDTEPVDTAACEAILAAARGAVPGQPVWVVPVGPGTNAASAVLRAAADGLKLEGRVRVLWLGGSNNGITGEFNGDNDPWSLYVLARSGVDLWIMPAPVGARVTIDKHRERELFPDTLLGGYLWQITPSGAKPLFDPACLAVVIGEHRGLDWVRKTEFVTIGGPDRGYRWDPSAVPTSVRVIRDIDHAAIKRDLFRTLQSSSGSRHSNRLPPP